MSNSFSRMIPFAISVTLFFAISITWFHCHFSHMIPLSFQSHDSIYYSVLPCHIENSMDPDQLASSTLFSSKCKSGLEVIKLEFILRLKIKHNHWLLADTCACGHISASSQSLCFILSLKMYSGFITLRPGTSRTWNNIPYYSTVHIRSNCLFFAISWVTELLTSQYFWLLTGTIPWPGYPLPC